MFPGRCDLTAGSPRGPSRSCIARSPERRHLMLKHPLRGLVVALTTVAALYSCSNNGGSPTDPQALHRGARIAATECGVSLYLENLHPVLLSWQDSLETDSLHLDTPPDPADAHSVNEHVTALVPVLQQWQGAINDMLNSSLLDSLPAFNPDSTSGEDYTEHHLAPTLTGWETALEGQHGSAFLTNLPVIVPDTTPPVISCLSDTTVGCAQDSIAFDFKVSAVDECDDNPTVTSVPESGSMFPVGPTLVTVTAKDRSGNTSTCTFTVNVEGGSPATVEDVTAQPRTLWPPNHKMVNVRIHVDVDSDCPTSDVTWKILEVRSSEAANGTGDGNTSPDWIITGDHGLQLRAERSGNGGGRVYSVHVESDTDSGPIDDRWIDVTVPHDQGHGHH
jgi:HYR domain